MPVKKITVERSQKKNMIAAPSVAQDKKEVSFLNKNLILYRLLYCCSTLSGYVFAFNQKQQEANAIFSPKNMNDRRAYCDYFIWYFYSILCCRNARQGQVGCKFRINSTIWWVSFSGNTCPLPFIFGNCRLFFTQLSCSRSSPILSVVPGKTSCCNHGWHHHKKRVTSRDPP